MDSSPNMPKAGFGSMSADSGRKVAQKSPEEVLEGHARAAFPATPRSALIKIIEGEISPRLFLAHREATVESFAPPPRAFGNEPPVTTEYLAGLFLDGARAEIVRRLQALLDSGMEREKIYLELLASVPRALTDLWEKGFCTFDGMTGGLVCLDRVLADLHEHERTTGA